MPRPSDGWNAARRPQSGTPGPAGRTPPPVDPLESLLEGYARSTEITPAPDLSRRVHAAISREPARTPPRRFLVALFGFRLAAARDAFAQTAGVAVGRGRFPALVRAQAMALVILTLGVVGVGAVGAAVGLRGVVDGLDLDPPPVQVVVSPSPSPSASPTASPSPSPSPSPSASSSASPSPTVSPSPEPTDEPTEDPTDDPTAEPTENTTVQVRRTQAPDDETKATPKPTQRPRATAKPTPKATREPKETEKPRRTSRPTKTPKPAETEKPDDDDDDDDPDETDEPDDDDDDNSGSGGNSGPGSADRSASRMTVAVGPVLLVITV
jgi:hypothetical protein